MGVGVSGAAAADVEEVGGPVRMGGVVRAVVVVGVFETILTCGESTFQPPASKVVLPEATKWKPQSSVAPSSSSGRSIFQE